MSSPEKPPVLRLDEVDSSMVSLVGGKAANLGECFNAGLLIPPGFCITTKAMAAAFSHSQGSVPSWFTAAVFAAYADLDGEQSKFAPGSVPVAVRSSATLEDSASASFAGQGATFLGIVGQSALLHAIEQIWTSFASHHATSYREASGLASEDMAVAVVVQALVPADAAGVLFTTNPVTGSDQTMLVNASLGLGELVVAGRVTPDTFELSSAGSVVAQSIGGKAARADFSVDVGVVESSVPESQRAQPCLSASELRDLAALARRVRDHYGSPQDIEWAISAGQVFLLQSRPITGLVRRVEPHPMARGRVALALRDDVIEHFPAPFPLDLHAVHEVEQGFLDLASSGGIRLPKATQLIYGDRDGVIRVKATRPRPTIAALVRLPRLLRRGWLATGENWAGQAVVEAERLQGLARRLADTDGADLAALLDIADVGIAEANRLTRLRCHEYLVGLVVWRARVGWLVKRAGLRLTPEDMFAGLEYVTSAATTAVAGLADIARTFDLAKLISQRPASELEAELRDVAGGAEFLAAWQQLLARFGARTANAYLPFSTKSWREDQDSLLRVIAQAAQAPAAVRPTARDVVAEVEAALPVRARGHWRRAVGQLRALHVAREGTVYALEEYFALARAAMLAVGEALVAAGRLESTSDLKFLYRAEVRRAIEDPGADLRHLVAPRNRLRPQAEAIWWPKRQPKAALVGVPGGAGVVQGRARVINTMADSGRLGAGEVLVCPYTDPSWTPLFLVASAVVVDLGGPLSHAAIVAREYGIPAVMGVGNATETIPDGAWVLVDGTKGVVELIPTDQSPSP